MNFQENVIERSKTIPVVVDFWAPWCGPCRTLGPVLDALAKSQEGRWELCKVNTEEYPEISSQYRVMSIPAVKLFHNGEVIDEFVGALPRASIERWLDKALPNPADDALNELLASYASWPDKKAISALESFLANHPNHKKARLALARHRLGDHPEQIPELIQDIRMGDELYEEAQHLLTVKDWLEAETLAIHEAGSVLSKARDAFHKGDWEETIREVIESVKFDKDFHEGLPRRLAIAIFALLGFEHPLTLKYRRLFDMSLY